MSTDEQGLDTDAIREYILNFEGVPIDPYASILRLCDALDAARTERDTALAERDRWQKKSIRTGIELARTEVTARRAALTAAADDLEQTPAEPAGVTLIESPPEVVAAGYTLASPSRCPEERHEFDPGDWSPGICKCGLLAAAKIHQRQATPEEPPAMHEHQGDWSHGFEPLCTTVIGEQMCRRRYSDPVHSLRQATPEDLTFG